MSCDVYAHDQAAPGQTEGAQRRSTFRGWRNTWSSGENTYLVTKGERIAATGEKVKTETMLRRRETKDGDLTRETNDYAYSVIGEESTSTIVTHQEDLVRVSGARRELVSRRVDGETQADVHETVITTQESATQRTTETVTTGPVRMKVSSDADVRIVLEVKSVCTYAIPAL